MGNDTGTLAGPNRIRLRAAKIRLDTYSVSVRNDASARIDETNLRLIVKSNGNVGINQVNPSQKLDVGGNIKASKFIGNGSTITNINANNITSGIVNNARLNEASTNLAGIVQLINSNTSTSTTRAPTANALVGVKAALNSEIGSTFFGNSGGDGFMRFPYGPGKYILVQWGQTEKNWTEGNHITTNFSRTFTRLWQLILGTNHMPFNHQITGLAVVVTWLFL